MYADDVPLPLRYGAGEPEQPPSECPTCKRVITTIVIRYTEAPAPTFPLRPPADAPSERFTRSGESATPEPVQREDESLPAAPEPEPEPPRREELTWLDEWRSRSLLHRNDGRW